MTTGARRDMIERAPLLDLATPFARAQLAASRALLKAPFARALPARDAHALALPRVLLTAFHRFAGVAHNATASMLRALVPTLELAEVGEAKVDSIDPPGAQHAFADARVAIGDRNVLVRAVVLPVHWDLAAGLALRHVDAFAPELVLMSGVAAAEGPLRIERGASNRAALRLDASGHVRPRSRTMDAGTSLESLDEGARTTLSLDVDGALQTALRAIAKHGATEAGGVRFDAVVRGAAVGDVRDDNAYLCNQLAFVVDHAMRAGGTSLRLLRSDDAPDGVPVALPGDHRAVPRGFLHWPSALSGAHITAGAEVLRAIVAACL